MELTEAYLEYGTIRYVEGVDATPTTSSTTGNVTVNNIGRPGTPGHFLVTFQVQSTLEIDGISTNPYISLTVPVVKDDRGMPYREIEMQAASEVASVLRTIAARVQAQIDDLTAQGSSSPSETPAD